MTDQPPDSVLLRILDGANPVPAIREWRKVDVSEVADAAGIGVALLTEIEGGRPATPAQIGAIASVLNVKPGHLVMPQDGGGRH